MDNPALEARGVSKTYGRGAAAVPVLRSLDLCLRAAEFAVILGPSGSGKSTLLNVLGLMDRPESGELLLFGRPTSALDEEARAILRNESLGFIFQFDSLLPEFTAVENVALPARIRLARGKGEGRGPATLDEAHERARELLSRLGLRALGERFPAQLSGGERQRVAVCRALVNRPLALLADEPTGNLDKQNGERVFKDLRRLAEEEGVAVVMVTHNEAARAYAGRVLHMSDGAIAPEPEKIP